jgi:hypothetical protein
LWSRVLETRLSGFSGTSAVRCQNQYEVFMPPKLSVMRLM